jgi:precorrin-8X/cobalt-precorrin-8 methylmutase
MVFERLSPQEIERRSFALIQAQLPHPLPAELAPIIMRVIHTTADFDYADSLYFSPGVLSAAHKAFLRGERIVTDTNMARAGVNKGALDRLGCVVECFMADDDVAAAASEAGTTRAAACMDKATALPGRPIFVVGNAPTALIRLHELLALGKVAPSLIIAAPVGFVHVVQAKQLILDGPVPCIVARGQKGGSNVAAAIVNGLMYQLLCV